MTVWPSLWVSRHSRCVWAGVVSVAGRVLVLLRFPAPQAAVWHPVLSHVTTGRMKGSF